MGSYPLVILKIGSRGAGKLKLNLGLFFCICVLLPSSNGTQDIDLQGECGECGELYSGYNSQGEYFVFLDRDQSPDLREDLRAVTSGWNATGSVEVRDLCHFNICDGTYFTGSCRTLNHGSYSGKETTLLRNAASAECTCNRVCRCSDIHIKRSSCGRAYLEGGCQTCNSLYVDLFVGMAPFPEDLTERVTALRLRRGCTLKIYEDDEFGGEETLTEEDILEDFEGVIGSYDCECDDNLYLSKARQPYLESYPEMINIPTNMDAVNQMLSTTQYEHHAGLQYARLSFLQGRSHKNAYILVLGSTGSGKSSAINLLLDNPKMAAVGDFASTTRQIQEFRIPVPPMEELGLANAELRVIDTPGLGDTRGLEYDAQYLATLDKYLSTHEELRDRIPNAVLIFHRFDDVRFDGEGSAFVRMIRGLDTFSKRITDDRFSNVIFVLTHFCSTLEGTKRQPEGRLKRFKKVIEDHTLYPRPTLMVVAENKGYEQDLRKVNGNFKMPNGEYYPRNLFEKLELITEKWDDALGQVIFLEASRNLEGFNGRVSTFNGTGLDDARVTEYLKVLTNANVGVTKTPIAQHLEDVWNTEISINLRRRYSASLRDLQKALYLRNIIALQDVPQSIPDILTLRGALKDDIVTKTLLEKGLHVAVPDFPGSTIAGYGYDVFQDRPLSKSPFNTGNLSRSDSGFMIPTSLSCHLTSGTEQHFYVHKDKQEYLKDRLEALGVEGPLRMDQFTNNARPSSNIVTESCVKGRCTLTASKDFRLFEFTLNPKAGMAPEFENVVETLPVVNTDNPHSVVKWRQFFHNYGTHVVQRIYGGGSIQIKLEMREPLDTECRTAMMDLLKHLEEMTNDKIEDGQHGLYDIYLLNMKNPHTISFSGGNPEFSFQDLFNGHFTKSPLLATKWKNSLRFNPVLLTTNMSLLPISEIVKNQNWGENYSAEMEKATRLMLNASLVYTPTLASPIINASRVEEMVNLLAEADDRISDLNLQLQGKRAMSQRLASQLRRERARWREQTARVEAELEQLRDLRKKEQIANARKLEILKLGKKKMVGLKAGTQILMRDRREKAVEELKVGDVILDKDLQPTTVLEIIPDLLLRQRFYGFEEGDLFFTKYNLFAGPISPRRRNSKVKFYAVATDGRQLENPLGVHAAVKEMGMQPDNTVLSHLDRSSRQRRMSTLPVSQIFEGEYPEDTLKYTIKVDSPTGTYICNGYVCRQELPPLKPWPNTLALVYKLMTSPVYVWWPLIPYTKENVERIQEAADEVAEEVDTYLAEKLESKRQGRLAHTLGLPRMTLNGVNMKQYISNTFSNSPVSQAILDFNARMAAVIAEYLDSEEGSLVEGMGDTEVASLQYGLYNFISRRIKQVLAQNYLLFLKYPTTFF